MSRHDIHPASAALAQRLVTGQVAGLTSAGRVLVTWPERETPCAAEILWQPGDVDWARCRGSRVLLALTDGDRPPVVLGLLDPPPEPEAEAPGAAPEQLPEYRKLESGRELILECGKARISLRADGRITILGGYILSRSTGVHKIKGGSVEIN